MAANDFNLGKQSAPPPTENPISVAWFPAVAIRPFYDEYRVPAELPAAQVREHLKGAVARCMAALADTRAAALLAGHAALTDLPGDDIDGEHVYAILWRRAVYCEAKAEILKETQLVSLGAAKTQADGRTVIPAEETEHKYREFAAEALAQIATGHRIDVELL